MKKLKLAIVDVLGLSYDGSTLETRGLGGSESAVIRISRELVNLNIDVTVFNDCTSDKSKPGYYDGVLYRPLADLDVLDDYYDVVISSRSVAPFAPTDIKDQFKSFISLPDFTKLQEKSRYKIIWMHDTFCDGDNLIEPYLLQGRINELFTLSDWHTNYVTSCDHGVRRNFDIIRPHIFQTRNGIGAIPKAWIDIRAKDPNLFVFNSSVTKGMIPLVTDIWPRVKELIPEAKLKVIGGYYRFREGSEPDQQEKDWRNLVASNPGIEFTGIISQDEISEILTKATYLIYPPGFPETFGISTLEALAHNVTPITCDFGALAETALDLCSWKLPYPVEPNWALPWLNKQDQVDRFVNLVVEAHSNKYLQQQKQYACNQVKDICTWDTVALQWKQHLYRVTGWYLPREETRAATKLSSRVKEVFSTKWMNAEELSVLKQRELPIKVIIPCWNAEAYIETCILSVAQQDYAYYDVYIIDDASTDSTFEVIEKTIASLPESIKYKFYYSSNTKNLGALQNQWNVLKNISSNSIVMLLDGDDALVNDPYIFHKYNNLYHGDIEITYGSCWSVVDNIPLIAQEYPPEIKTSKSYKNYRFNWNMPYTHLRTFHSKLISKISDSDLKINGDWPKAGGDTSLFYSLLEVADPERVKAVTDVHYLYNDASPYNDYKVNGAEQTMTANKVLSKTTNRWSVIMPTMWRCSDYTLASLERILTSEEVGEILIIDNDPSRTPMEGLARLDDERIKISQQETNIGVNPAWNLGVSQAAYPLICIMNDDISFDPYIFNTLTNISAEDGFYGAIYGNPELGQPKTVSSSISFKTYEPGDNIHPFGQLFFFAKSNWRPIPDIWKLNYGDEYIFHWSVNEHKPPKLIYNFLFTSLNSVTVRDPSVSLAHDEANNLLERTAWGIYYSRFYQEGNRGDPSAWISKNLMSTKKKKILLAIPTAKYIEVETFKSIYDLEIPEGYEVDFRYSFGYNIDQVRNLIADWACKDYDYLFSVDSDIIFPPDTLKKLIEADKDIVSGIYRQRTENKIELYSKSYERLDYSSLGTDLQEIGGCGFGCVLVKSEALRKVGYPQFEYHSALDHSNTFSEDLDFCNKVRLAGFTIWVEPSVLCGHIGATTLYPS